MINIAFFSILISLALFVATHAQFDIFNALNNGLGIFLATIVGAFLFVYLWKKDIAQPHQEAETQQDETNISSLLNEFKQAIVQWQLSENKDMLVNKVEEIAETYLLPLNHQHQTIKATYGEQGLNIILNLAQAERLLNRIQSAALDGYPQEVQTSYSELEQTVQLLK